MDFKLFNFALLEIGLSIIIGVSILYFTFRITDKIVRRRFDMGTDNTAYGIFIAAILFSVGYIVSSVIEPLISTFRLLNSTTDSAIELWGGVAKYLLLFFLISTTIAFIINILGIFLFTLFTSSVNEMEEIQKNNISVALITATIIIVLTLFAKDGILLLLETIVPYPEMPQIS